MRAAYYETTGGPDVLRVGERPTPTCGPADVLIRVHSASIDRVDLYGREGSHGMQWPTPFVGGRDAAGTIIEAGAEVAKIDRRLTAGAKVLAMASGTHAEFAVAPAALTFPIPARLSFEEAAAVPTAGRTALDAILHRLEVTAGEDVLVVAGGSGVGSFGIQIARAAGARVITTVGSEEKKRVALALGADVAVNHYTEDIVENVKAFTGGAGVHAVLDHVGTPVWEAVFRSLRPRGRFCTTGVTAGHRVSLHLGKLFIDGYKLMGIGRSDQSEMRSSMLELLRLVELGKVTPVVAATFPLERIADAHRLMEASTFFGKVILTNRSFPE